jgi:hypothetical protein
MTATTRPPLHMSCGCIWEGPNHEKRTKTCTAHQRH